MKKLLATATAGAFLAMGATLAAAQTLYKLVDKDGKVTYSETPPKPGEFNGQVTRIDVDPNRNTATLPKPKEVEAKPERSSRGQDGVADPPKSREMVVTTEDLRGKLEAAKKALADAQNNPGEGDLEWIGNKGGGARSIPSPGYVARLEMLERQVKAAEEALRRAEGR